MKSTAILCVVLIAACNLSATLTPTSTAVSSSQNPSIYGQSVTFTAVVSSAIGAPPNGETVTFKQGSTAIGTSTLNKGSATFSISTLKTGGSDNIKAVYTGDSTFSGSTSAVIAQVVNPAPTTTTVGSSLNPANVGQSVTLTAVVAPQFSGSVTGSVTFYNGSTKLGSATLSGGAASLAKTNLPAGSDPITAVYKGNTTFLTSTSKAFNQTIGSGTVVNTTISWDGVTRYYQLFVPTVLPANPPLLVMLHGTSFEIPPDNPSTKDWGWQSVANLYGFIVAQPASTYNTSTGQWNWNAYFMDDAFIAPAPDDSGFLRQLIANLESQYKVNSKMIFVTGMSSGAQMAERVGVELSDIVAAIAPTSGQLVGQEIPPPGLPSSAVAPVSVQEWHGTLDTELPPCNYATTKYSGVTFTLDTVDDTFDYWVQQNSCSHLQTSQNLCTNGVATQGLSGNDATSCKSNVEVQFIWESGVAHSWKAQNNTARWQFLSAHPKP
ncbi:MAG TPA: Ig-like domain repeat protein [Candidatus Solibacter sp.]|nr:Ig-like domain repeat protein [Candidatus Solibacter sp.]